jgi:hypothetical protein
MWESCMHEHGVELPCLCEKGRAAELRWLRKQGIDGGRIGAGSDLGAAPVAVHAGRLSFLPLVGRRLGRGVGGGCKRQHRQGLLRCIHPVPMAAAEDPSLPADAKGHGREGWRRGSKLDRATTSAWQPS